MTKHITVYTAEPSDVWPDGSGLSPQAEREIMEIAKTIPHDDVARSGLVFAPWFTPFYMAEGQWRQRQKQQSEQQQQKRDTETDNAKRIARLERRLSKTVTDVNLIYSTLLSAPKDDPKGELQLFRLIRNIAWGQITEQHRNWCRFVLSLPNLEDLAL